MNCILDADKMHPTIQWELAKNLKRKKIESQSLKIRLINIVNYHIVSNWCIPMESLTLQSYYIQKKLENWFLTFVTLMKRKLDLYPNFHLWSYGIVVNKSYSYSTSYVILTKTTFCINFTFRWMDSFTGQSTM